MKRSLLKKIPIALFALMAVFSPIQTANAQINPIQCAPDSLFPEAGNCEYDVQHYDILYEWDESANLLKGDVTLRLASLTSASKLSLDFADHMIASEALVNGEIVPFEQQPQNLLLYFDFQKETNYQIRVIYSGIAEEHMILQSGSVPLKNQTEPFCIVSEPDLASRWFPCNDTPKDKASFSVQITVPAKYAAASNGRLEEIRYSDGTVHYPQEKFSHSVSKDAVGTVTYQYQADSLMTPYLFTVCISDFDIKQQLLRPGLLQLDFYQQTLQNREAFQNWAELMPDMLKCFEPAFGTYPFRDTGSIVIEKSFGGALETQTRSVYGSDMIYTGVNGFSHELAHQWIGNLVSIADWSDLWIKEGFATFAESFWMKCAQGENAFREAAYQNYLDMGNLLIQIENTAKIARQYLEHDAVRSATFNQEQIIREGINLICDISSDAGDSLAVPLPETPVSGETLWQLAQTRCRTMLMEPLKRQKLNEFFGIDLDFGQVLYGPTRITADYDSMYSQNPYAGGALVYLALYQKMGEEKFFEAVRLMSERYAYDVINRDAFIALFSEVSGEDLSLIIQEWLEYSVLPDYPLTEDGTPGKTYSDLLSTWR